METKGIVLKSIVTYSAATNGGSENSPNAELEESCPVIQNEGESARTNLAEDDSIIENEQEARSFNGELQQIIDKNTLSRVT